MLLLLLDGNSSRFEIFMWMQKKLAHPKWTQAGMSFKPVWNFSSEGPLALIKTSVNQACRQHWYKDKIDNHQAANRSNVLNSPSTYFNKDIIRFHSHALSEKCGKHPCYFVLPWAPITLSADYIREHVPVDLWKWYWRQYIVFCKIHCVLPMWTR